MSRRAPRRLEAALGALGARLAPATPLAAVEAAWSDAVGSQLAAVAQPVSERAGVVTVACREAVWAQELELLGPELVSRINTVAGREVLTAIRCRATL